MQCIHRKRLHMHRCVSKHVYMLIERTPPPRGVSLFTLFPDQEAGAKRNPLNQYENTSLALMRTRRRFDTYLCQVVKSQGEPLRVIETADAYINMKERHVHLCIHT